MVVRERRARDRWIVVVAVASLLLLLLALAPGAEEDYTLGIPEDVLACARALAWSSGYRHITHSDERWSVRENAPQEMCEECGAPMCVVCMEYDLGTYDSRPAVPAALRGCQNNIESYLRSATDEETEILAAVYWAAYWDGRHNEVGEGEPAATVAGQPEAAGGVGFETPFILGIDSLRVEGIADCSASSAMDPASVTAEFVFGEALQPFLQSSDLELVILTADGYASEVITDFAEEQVGTGSSQVTCLVPLQSVVCLAPLAQGVCTYCTVKLEILSDNGTTVKARLVHCAEDGKWEQWFKGDLVRHKDAPPAECKTCTYWLKYEQVSILDQNGKPMNFGKYTLYHCSPDNVWQQVYVHTVDKVKELPKGPCSPGREIIVVTETTRGGKTTVRHDLYRCSSAGQWVRIGSWTETKG